MDEVLSRIEKLESNLDNMYGEKLIILADLKMVFDLLDTPVIHPSSLRMAKERLKETLMRFAGVVWHKKTAAGADCIVISFR